MIVVAVLTCGRREYMERTMASFAARVSGPVTRTVIFDDSGDPEYRKWLRETFESSTCSVVHWGRNQGYTVAMGHTWSWLARHCVEPYVFHLEEDFVFDRPINLGDMVAVLDAGAHLDQVALLRGPFFRREIEAGGIPQQNPDAYLRHEVGGHEVLEHNLVFTTNPCMYRRSFVDIGWPPVKNSEREFGRQRAKAGGRSAYMGNGEPWVTHIGDERTMTGY